MFTALFQVAVAIAGVAGILAVLRAMLAPATSLGLSIFKPYRGDPWPRGVQEDDTIRFDWSPKAPRPVTPEPNLADAVVRGAVGDAPFLVDPVDTRIEDVTGDVVGVEPLQGISVHHPTH